MNSDRERSIVGEKRKRKRVLGRIRGIGWRKGLQQQTRPLRMVETRS